jgi:hypothetical protein
MAFLERVDLEGTLVKHGRELLAEQFEMRAVRLEVPQQLSVCIKTYDLDNMLGHNADLGIRASTVRRTKEDYGMG